MEMRNFRPFDSPPSRIPLASARSPAEKNPGNDSAAVPGVWQPSSPKRKLNFSVAALAGPSTLIKDNVPRKATTVLPMISSTALAHSSSARGSGKDPGGASEEHPMSEQIKTNRPYPIQLKLRDGHNAVIRVMEPGD